MINYTDVLVVPRYSTEFILNGFTYSKIKPDSILSNASFVSINDAMGSIILNQIIPYVVFKHKDKYLVCNVKNKFYSLGIYGRVCSDMERNSNSSINDAIKNVLMKENLNYIKPEKMKFIGYLRDNLNFVNCLGCIFLSTDRIKKLKDINTDDYTYHWMSVSDIVNKYFKFEKWSKTLIDDYIMVEEFKGEK